MYKQITLEHVVQIPPELFGISKEESTYQILSREYQGMIDSDLGFVIAICEIIKIGTGKIIHGNGGTFHPVRFSVLTYNPIMHEVVEGEVVELVDFGAFIRLGPSDGLCHLSQITDDKLNFENISARFVGIDSGKILEVGDQVRTRVIAVSVGSGRSGKLGLTMRQPFLGKIEWIQEELEKKNKEALDGKEKIDEKPKKKTSKKSKKKSSKKK
ncbi:MAG: DNA-directed RNA polymerase [archaeon]|nr:DNA-directed RNA polymerase [archaeon]